MKLLGILFLLYCIPITSPFLHKLEKLLKDKSTMYRESQISAKTTILEEGYPVEEHEVQTTDGYVLTLLRIPHALHNSTRHGIPILILPGLSCKAKIFVETPKLSIAYFLADLGYDVWLGNNRGSTRYSRHIIYPQWSSKFWDFSWQDQGLYDIPSLIDHVRTKTRYEQVILMTFSMTGAAVLALHATSPEYNNKVARHIALGPVADGHYQTSILITLLMPFYKPLKTLFHLLYIKGLLNSGLFAVTQPLLPALCLIFGDSVCHAFFSLLLGYDPGLNMPEITMTMSDITGGTSFKTFIHLLQQIIYKEMRYYDYGPVKNLRLYGSKLPPKFDLTKITAPTSILYGANDAGATSLNTITTSRRMKNVTLVLMESTMFVHPDFVWSVDPAIKMDVNRKIYNEIKNIHLKRTT